MSSRAFPTATLGVRNLQADFNGDGEVGIYEFLQVLGNWS